jgi:hypothetical protein
VKSSHTMNAKNEIVESYETILVNWCECDKPWPPLSIHIAFDTLTSTLTSIVDPGYDFEITIWVAVTISHCNFNLCTIVPKKKKVSLSKEYWRFIHSI